MARYVIVIQDPERGWDCLTICGPDGQPFEDGDQAKAEARRWRNPDVRVMVRTLWTGDDLRRMGANSKEDLTP